MKLSEKDKILFKSKIQFFYKQYKEFVLGVDMPELDNQNIQIVDFGNTIGEPIARIIPPNNRNGKYILKIDYSLYFMNNVLKSILFHEFTHILDYSSLFNNLDDQEALIKLYSEYHASQIQMKALLGFYNLEDNKNIMFKDMIYDVDKLVTVEKYFLDKRNEYITILNQSNLFNKDNLRQNTYNLMYYLGNLSVIKNHCNEDLREILDINIFIGRYGVEMKKIIDILELYDDCFNTEEFKLMALKSILANYILIMKKFEANEIDD